MRALAREAWPFSIAAAGFVLVVGSSSADTDTWWQLASGRWMVEHRELLRLDIFSSTATGEPYDLGEWLGQILLYFAFAAGSWPALAVLRAALVALAGLAATRSALRFAPARVAVPVAAFALILSKPTWTDRPQLFTLALFPVLLELLLAARSGSRGALIATVPLVFVWSDLHGGYALGLVLVWLFAIDALLERRHAAELIVAAGIATIVVTANPGALSLARTFTHVVGATRGIVEESPVDVMTPFGAFFAVFVIATFAAFLSGRGSLLGAIVLVPMLWLALSAQRHIPLFGFASVPFLADALARPLRRERAPEAAARALFLPIALWIGAIASITTVPSTPDATMYPTAALPTLRSTSGILLNEYDWGGWLIWNAPNRPVFVDGRLFPYVTDGVFDQYRAALVVLPGWRATLERWNVTQALLRPARPLTQALRDEGWIVRSEDAQFVLLEKPTK